MIETLLKIFPEDRFALIAIILGMPLLGAVVNGIWGNRLGKPAVKFMALFVMIASFFACVLSFAALNHLSDGHSDTHHKLAWTAWEWMRTSNLNGGTVPIQLRFSIDALSGVMMLIVTGIGFLIHLYASSYMENDPGYPRFFAYLNLFVFSMLVLILGDNLPVLFIGWEGVGLCSYLLIGFWYTGKKNAAAGKKAFIANRIGDFGLIMAMGLLLYYTGALDWDGIQNGADSLLTKTQGNGSLDVVCVWPVGCGKYGGILSFLNSVQFQITGATAVGIALFLGCTGKSAQLPLYVWLPDAMAGPTPVSALIHAATMVTAGVYLVCRLSFVFALSPAVMTLITATGAATALLAATIALVQNDIKKVLAYSTVSQLGFMFIGVGSGAFTAGFFHVLTHAFFKACLFLGAGSVIHAMHARIHDEDRSQDMRNMGGLAKFMPHTSKTFLVSTLAISGAPLLSGFFSKDEILYRAFTNKAVQPLVNKKLEAFGVFQQPDWFGPVIYGLGILAATMTAFYMFRCYFLTFHGEFRGWTIGRSSKASIPPEGHDAHGHDDHHEEDLSIPGPAPHESPMQMTIPLIVLATLAAFGGILNPAPISNLLHKEFFPLEHWLRPVFAAATEGAKRGITLREEHALPGKIAATVSKSAAEWAHHLEWTLAAGGIAAFAVGCGLAYWMYVVEKGEPARKLAMSQPFVHKFLMNKWYVDEFYGATVIGSVDALADTAAVADRNVVDMFIARISALLVSASGTVLRAFQTGVVHTYGAIMVLGMVALGWFFVSPHAEFTSKATADGFKLEAAPGFGYSFRWDANGDGKADSETFANTKEALLANVAVKEGETKKIILEVKNAFGFVGSKNLTLSKPAAEKTKTIDMGGAQ